MYKCLLKNKLGNTFKSKFKITNFTNLIYKEFATTKTIEECLKKSITFESLNVEDTSGNCGAAFKIIIKSKEFNGKGLVQQHRMVTDILKDELKDVHSIVIKTEEIKNQDKL